MVKLGSFPSRSKGFLIEIVSLQTKKASLQVGKTSLPTRKVSL